jgi:hypothetical protein
VDDMPLPLQILAVVLGLATAVWITWCTVIAFIGGTMPIIGWEVDGGIGFGLLFLFIIEPILLTLAYWAVLLVMLPLMFLFGRRRDG